MKQKLLALIVASVMVASVFGAIGLGATKVGASGESLTLQTSNANPNVSQPYTLSGLLTDSNGPLAGKSIDVFYHFEGAAWVKSNTLPPTGADGKYSTITSSSKTIYVQTGYQVGNTYVASSNVVKITVQAGATTLTLSSSNYAPTAGQHYTLSGRLTDSVGNGVANKYIKIKYHFEGDNSWHFSNNVGPTDADGWYSTSTYSTAVKKVYIMAVVDNGGVNEGSSSNVVIIDVQPIQLIIQLYVDLTTVPPHFPYTLTGRVLDPSQIPKPNWPVDVWYRTSTSEFWHYSNTIYTDANGYYSTTTSSSQTINIRIVYGTSFSNTVQINVT